MKIAARAEAGGEAGGLAAEPTDGQSEFPGEFIEIVAAPVPQLDPLEQIPDALIGVELRGVAGQAFQVQPLRCTGGEEVLDRLTVMDRRTVPDHQQLAPHVPQQLAEEGDDRRPAERLPLDVGEQPPVRRDGADHGEVVARERDAQDGSLTAWGIGARDERQQIEGGLVYEEDRAVFGAGFA